MDSKESKFLRDILLGKKEPSQIKGYRRMSASWRRLINNLTNLAREKYVQDQAAAIRYNRNWEMFREEEDGEVTNETNNPQKIERGGNARTTKKEILRFIGGRTVTTAEIAGYFGICRQMARKHMRQLVDDGVLEKSGSTRKAKYWRK